MTDTIFNQVCIPDEEDVEFLFQSTRNWSKPPSKDKIREDLKDPLKHINYMYPEQISFKEIDHE